MRSLIFTAAILISSAAHAKDQACTEFSNAAVGDAPQAARLKLTLVAINEAYPLGYTAAQLEVLNAKFSARIDSKELALDNVERVALFACMNQMTADEIKITKEYFDTVLAGK